MDPLKSFKILVPVDFSICSTNALRCACQLARQLDASLVIMHADLMPAMAVSMGEPIVQHAPVMTHQELKSIVSKWENEIHELRVINYEVEELAMPLVEAIKTISETRYIDLIVMGTHSHESILERVMGSNTTDVLQVVDVPLLVIPDATLLFFPKKVGIAIDAKSIKSVHYLTLVSEIAQLTNASISIFYVGKPGELIHYEESPYKDIFDTYFKYLDHQFFNLNESDPTDGIFQFIDKNEIDLLVMFPRQHSFWDRLMRKSISRSLALQSKVPLLLIKEN